jgi:hypothetical protein
VGSVGMGVYEDSRRKGYDGEGPEKGASHTFVALVLDKDYGWSRAEEAIEQKYADFRALPKRQIIFVSTGASQFKV